VDRLGERGSARPILCRNQTPGWPLDEFKIVSKGQQPLRLVLADAEESHQLVLVDRTGARTVALMGKPDELLQTGDETPGLGKLEKAERRRPSLAGVEQPQSPPEQVDLLGLDVEFPP
jgi:hypothetical protein